VGRLPRVESLYPNPGRPLFKRLNLLPHPPLLPSILFSSQRLESLEDTPFLILKMFYKLSVNFL
jgi:hypothetical protein